MKIFNTGKSKIFRVEKQGFSYTQKNNNMKFKANDFKISNPYFSGEDQLDLRTLSTNTIIDILEANMLKRENLFSNTDLSKKLNK